ncbi:MAG: MFS transporter [Bacteroidales bacterium]|nr:MFS transporter [Bacteroidales bacterium]
MNNQKRYFKKDLQYYKFCFYGFLKNLRLFEPFIILFFLENGLTFLQIGILYSIREITRNIFEIPAGIISDSLGRKKTMIASFGLYIVSFVTYYFAQSYAVFIIAMIIYSFGDAFRTGTHKAMIFDYLKMNSWEDQKVYYYGYTRSWSQFGSAISALVAGFLVFFSGSYRMIFIYSALPYILDLLLIASYPKELNGQVAGFSQKRISERFRDVFRDFFYTLFNRRSLKSIANLSMFTGYYKAVKDYLQPVLQGLAISMPILLVLEEKQRTAIIIGVIYFFIYLMTSFLSRKSGFFSARFKFIFIPLNITLLGGFIFGLMSGILFEYQLVIVAVIAYIIIYLVENLRKPIGISFITENIDNRILATVLSAESQAHALVAAIIAPIIGILADRLGVGYALAIISVLMILLAPIYMAKKKDMELKK